MIERKVAARQRDSAERAVHSTRLAIWLALVALLTFAQIYGRYVADSDTIDDPLYSSSFAASSLAQWILLGGIALGLAFGALVLFRIIYYILPFVLALALLALNEMIRRIRRHDI